MQGELLFLGTGGSTGIPTIGCHCRTCISSDAKNTRSRTSALLRIAGQRILVDVGPDFRHQALREKMDTVDGVVLTHAHFDHIAGIDELRIFYLRSRTPMPCLLSKPTYLEIGHRFPYIFHEPKPGESMRMQFAFQVLEKDFVDVVFCALPFRVVSYSQGGMQVTGFRIGDLAYLSDIKEYSLRVLEDVVGVHTLVVSALRKENSPFHFTIDEAIAFAERVGAHRTWLTHIAHEVEHREISAWLPPNIELAYDGLTIPFFVQ